MLRSSKASGTEKVTILMDVTMGDQQETGALPGSSEAIREAPEMVKRWSRPQCTSSLRKQVWYGKLL